MPASCDSQLAEWTSGRPTVPRPLVHGRFDGLRASPACRHRHPLQAAKDVEGFRQLHGVGDEQGDAPMLDDSQEVDDEELPRQPK